VKNVAIFDVKVVKVWKKQRRSCQYSNAVNCDFSKAKTGFLFYLFIP
jgi:hypothetical protein